MLTLLSHFAQLNLCILSYVILVEELRDRLWLVDRFRWLAYVIFNDLGYTLDVEVVGPLLDAHIVVFSIAVVIIAVLSIGFITDSVKLSAEFNSTSQKHLIGQSPAVWLLAFFFIWLAINQSSDIFRDLY